MNYTRIIILLMALFGMLIVSIIAFVIIVNIKEVRNDNNTANIDIMQDYTNIKQQDPLQPGKESSDRDEITGKEKVETVEQLEADNKSNVKLPDSASEQNETESQMFVPLYQLEDFYQQKRTVNVRGHPVFTINDREVTFN